MRIEKAGVSRRTRSEGLKYYSDIQNTLLDIPIRDTRVLVWTANHEHAVFDTYDPIHPAAVAVWFQEVLGNPTDGITDWVIHKFILKNGEWEYVKGEGGRGFVPFVNNNPFDPAKENAASNTAVSVFAENR